uniref:Toll like receptor 6 n=1 Tax=Sphenodon punctatus TaxID=8508 RepID=A0A8D0GVJ6_SPHPU
MEEMRETSNNRFLYAYVFAIILWNNIHLSEENLSVYEPKGLSGLNTKNLCIVLPNTTSLHFLSDLTLNVTESLDLSNIQREQVNDLTTLLSKLNKNSALLTLTLTNLTVTWRNFIIILQTVWHTPIEYFSIYSFKQVESIGKEQFNYEGTSLKALAIKEVTITEYYFNQNDVYSIFSEMNIKALTVSDAQLFYMLCPSKPSLFSYLCFSNNQLTDTVFKDCQNLLLLETLILQKNRFRMLSIVSSMTGNMKSLKYLDMSRNLLQYEEENGDKCQWADTLVKLNLSSNKLTNSVFRCLPKNTQMLDLQNNGITSVPKEITELKALEELNIAFNRLRDLPGCSRFTSLGLLNIEMNSILSPSSDFFHSCPNIRGLKAGHNPFECSCELRDFIRFEKQGGGQLIGWPESYVCEYPDGMKGTFLKDFHLSEVSCNTTLLLVIALVTIVVVMALVSFLCIFFDVLWYLKMMWQWTQAKRRVWDNHTEDLETVFEFHAFISYSERDSLWVKNVLIPNLEKEDGSVRICLHERNFIPGKTIVENIINCIEKSYKSIFVLSPNFVQSEWCHYELYFAHHKVFSENTDSLILILLESIPQYIIPARYHKLKALMAKRTYLEWPKEKGKHRLFWANLRAAINAKL